MSTLANTLPIALVTTIRPVITPATDESAEKHRERLAQKPLSFDVVKQARLARSMYQRQLLLQFMAFLASRLPVTHRGPSPG